MIVDNVTEKRGKKVPHVQLDQGVADNKNVDNLLRISQNLFPL